MSKQVLYSLFFAGVLLFSILEIAHPRFTQSRDCAHVLRNLEIAHKCYAIPRLPAQSQDSENAQRNLEIAQIPRLRKFPDCAEQIYEKNRNHIG